MSGDGGRDAVTWAAFLGLVLLAILVLAGCQS